MEQLKGLPLGRQLILGAGVLLLIDTFLPWQSWSFGPVSYSLNAWHGFWGVLLSLMTIAIVAWILVRAFEIELPANIPDGLTSLALGALILVFAVIKTLADSNSAWGAYVGIVLAAGVAYGGWLIFQASGESLPNLNTAGSSSPPPPPPDASSDSSPGTDLP